MTSCCLESGCVGRQCLHSDRPFSMSLKDDSQHEVIRLQRPFGGCCFFSVHDAIEVQAPPGVIIGHVKYRKWHLFRNFVTCRGELNILVCDRWCTARPELEVTDCNDTFQFLIRGPSYLEKCLTLLHVHKACVYQTKLKRVHFATAIPLEISIN